jgi:hypothetical protein
MSSPESFRGFTFAALGDGNFFQRFDATELCADLGCTFSLEFNSARHRARRATANQGRAGLCDSRTECAQEIGNQAYRQDQANPAAADDGTAKVKPAAAEQEKQNNY